MFFIAFCSVLFCISLELAGSSHINIIYVPSSSTGTSLLISIKLIEHFPCVVDSTVARQDSQQRKESKYTDPVSRPLKPITMDPKSSTFFSATDIRAMAIHKPIKGPKPAQKRTSIEKAWINTQRKKPLPRNFQALISRLRWILRIIDNQFQGFRPKSKKKGKLNQMTLSKLGLVQVLTKLGYQILELRFVLVNLEHIGSDYVLLRPDRPQKGNNSR
jgi:hypothetical protein